MWTGPASIATPAAGWHQKRLPGWATCLPWLLNRNWTSSGRLRCRRCWHVPRKSWGPGDMHRRCAGCGIAPASVTCCSRCLHRHSIHCDDRRPGELRGAQESFPLPIPGCPSVFHCGYAAESSFGATSYFVRRPQARGGGGACTLKPPPAAAPRRARDACPCRATFWWTCHAGRRCSRSGWRSWAACAGSS